MATEDYLKDTASLSLKQRVAQAKIRGQHTTVYRLKKLFKAKGIKFKTVRFRHRWRKSHDFKNKEKDAKVYELLHLGLKETVRMNRTIVWIDESLSNQKIVQKKAWALNGKI